MEKTEVSLVALGIIAILAVIFMIFLFKLTMTGDAVYQLKKPMTPGIRPQPGPYITPEGYIYSQYPRRLPVMLEYPGMETIPFSDSQKEIITQRGVYYYSPYLPYSWPRTYEQYPGAEGSPNLPNRQILR